MKTTINLNIERVVLHGIHQVDRRALAEALQQALQEKFVADFNLIDADQSRVVANIILPSSFGTEQLGYALGQGLSDLISNTSTVKDFSAKASQGGKPHG